MAAERTCCMGAVRGVQGSRILSVAQEWVCNDRSVTVQTSGRGRTSGRDRPAITTLGAFRAGPDPGRIGPAASPRPDGRLTGSEEDAAALVRTLSGPL